MAIKSENQVDIESVLVELGQFGRFQFFNYILIALPIGILAICSMSYLFAAGDLNYRCKVPECDSTSLAVEYNPEWLKHAIPFENELPAQCEHYVAQNVTPWTCSEENFDTSVIISNCDEFVYENNEETLLTEWNLTCDKNKWKLAFVGTLASLGELIGLPLSGFISDRFGRKPVFVYGMIFMGIFGVIKSFSWNYGSYLAFTLVESFLSSGIFATAFILGMELVGPKYRVFGGLVINVFYSFGQALLGLLAMFLQKWRILLLVLYAPMLIFTVYLWIIPESLRWLIANGRGKEAVKLILKVAKVNKSSLSLGSMEFLGEIKNNTDYPSALNSTGINEHGDTIWDALKNRTILLRVINCSFCWAANTFVYYGLSVISVSMGGNKYENFIYACLIEIPGIVLCWVLAEKLGRVKALSSSLICSGLACIAAIFVIESSVLYLILFLFGKFAITISFTILYTYTAELFPTSLRHSLFGICSTFGRIGSLLSPQVPLLEVVMKNLSMIVFSSVALIAAISTLVLPETLNLQLPANLQEAVEMEKQKTDSTKKQPEMEMVT